MKEIRNNISLVLFWAVAIYLLAAFLGVKGLWGPEDRWAEITREMLQTGDYFHPCINCRPYFDKPLLSYWLIALASIITGNIDEATVRLPSVVAGLLGLWATISLGRKLYSREQALTAGWILLTTYGFLFWARTGEADMENMAAVILAVAWYWSRRDDGSFWGYLVFYLICFLGAQTKGLGAVAVPVLVILPDLIRGNRWKQHLRWTHLSALLVGLFCYLAPFIYSEMTRSGYQANGLALAFRENIVRYFRPFDHKEPFYIFFYHLPQLFFPWIPLLIGAIWCNLANFRRQAWPLKWLTLAFVLIFLFFTMSGSRRGYYILPILPFAALLAANYLRVETNEKSKQLTINIQYWLLGAILLLEIFSPVAGWIFAMYTGVKLPASLFVISTSIGLLVWGCIYIERRREGFWSRLIGAEKLLALPIAGSIIIMGGFFTLQYQGFETLRTLKPFSRRLQTEIADKQPVKVAYYRNISPKVLFYMDLPQPVQRLKNDVDLQNFLKTDKETRILISDGKFYDKLLSVLPREMATRPNLQEKKYPWDKKPKYHAWIIEDRKK